MEFPTRPATAEREPFEEHVGWKGGLGAGLVATVVMGTGITVVEPGLLGQIAGLYGRPGSLVVGWLAHVFHGSLFGVAFAVVVADPSLANISHRYPGSIVAGFAYGIVLAVTGMGVIMPMWLQTIGLTEAPSIPFVTGSLIAWHILFGLVLGAVFPLIDRW